MRMESGQNALLYYRNGHLLATLALESHLSLILQLVPIELHGDAMSSSFCILCIQYLANFGIKFPICWKKRHFHHISLTKATIFEPFSCGMWVHFTKLIPYILGADSFFPSKFRYKSGTKGFFSFQDLWKQPLSYLWWLVKVIHM